MKTPSELKEIIIQHKPVLEQKFKVKEIGIYGSYARGEQRKRSDLDLIIEFKEEKSLGGLEFVGLMIELEEYLKEKLGIKVHLASKRQALKSDKWNNVKKDLIYV